MRHTPRKHDTLNYHKIGKSRRAAWFSASNTVFSNNTSLIDLITSSFVISAPSPDVYSTSSLCAAKFSSFTQVFTSFTAESSRCYRNPGHLQSHLTRVFMHSLPIPLAHKSPILAGLRGIFDPGKEAISVETWWAHNCSDAKRPQSTIKHIRRCCLYIL